MNFRGRARRLVGLIALLVGALALGLPSGAAAQGGQIAWGTVPSPNAGFGPNELNGVAVISSTDVWAVGGFGSVLFPDPQAQHWDGTQWTVTPLPDEIPSGELLGVAAAGPDDVWAVGGTNNDGDSLLLHWDGTEWSMVPHPMLGSYNRLHAVTVVSPNDAWAVGEYANGGISRTLALHWNGATWTSVPVPTDPGNYTQLLGVSAVSANEVWAVGERGSKTLSLRWDGTRWRYVPSPTPGGFGAFNAVSALPDGTVWAVGQAEGTLTARWTGRRWQVVPSPGGGASGLAGVVTLSPDDAWAVGNSTAGGNYVTLALHWDGTQWSQVASPNNDPSYNVLNAVDATDAGQVWAVGEGKGTLVARSNGLGLALFPSANSGLGTNELNGISMLSASDGWAVGRADLDSLTLRWNGDQWAIVPSPTTPTGSPLEGVVAIAANDVWAVGWTDGSGGLNSSTLTMRWNGTQWTTVPSPNPGGTNLDKLYDVDAVSSNEVWAVGEHWTGSSLSTATILRWNGTSWSVVPNPCGGGLYGIKVFSATAIWAVGNYTSCFYNGTTWARIPIDPSGGSDLLLDVSGTSPNNVWAVGQSGFCEPKFCYVAAYSARWNGTQWQEVDAPGTSLGGVEALPTGEVYAVGTFSIGTLILRWTGSAWQQVPSPDPDQGGELNTIDAAPGTNELWAAGAFLTGDLYESRTFIVNAPSETQGAVVGDTNFAGAVVTWIGPSEGTAVANSFGDYLAGGLLAGTYTFVVSGAGCNPDIATVEVIAGTTVTQDFQLDCLVGE